MIPNIFCMKSWIEGYIILQLGSLAGPAWVGNISYAAKQVDSMPFILGFHTNYILILWCITLSFCLGLVNLFCNFIQNSLSIPCVVKQTHFLHSSSLKSYMTIEELFYTISLQAQFLFEKEHTFWDCYKWLFLERNEGIAIKP